MYAVSIRQKEDTKIILKHKSIESFERDHFNSFCSSYGYDDEMKDKNGRSYIEMGSSNFYISAKKATSIEEAIKFIKKKVANVFGSFEKYFEVEDVVYYVEMYNYRYKDTGKCYADAVRTLWKAGK